MQNDLPIVKHNNPTVVYEIEKQISRLIQENADPSLINSEVAKLRKYSYQAYVKSNLNCLKTNPKEFHKCLQNIIKWNASEDNETSLDQQWDMDPSQCY